MYTFIFLFTLNFIFAFPSSTIVTSTSTSTSNNLDKNIDHNYFRHLAPAPAIDGVMLNGLNVCMINKYSMNIISNLIPLYFIYYLIINL